MVSIALASRCLVLFALSGYSFVCLGCEPGKEENPNKEWKVMISDSVAHGVVISTDPDPIPAQGVYSALFEVNCVYKGDPLPQVIRINKIDTCLNTSLVVGPKYLVYLKNDGDGKFIQQFRPESGEFWNLDEIVVVCEVEIQYPIGKNKTTVKEECPDQYTEEDCVQRPVLANPPYSNGDEEHSHGSSAETVDQQTKEKPTDEKSTKEKDIPKEYPASVADNNGNGSDVALTLNMGAVVFLLLAIILSV